jgi:hypothetical protein
MSVFMHRHYVRTKTYVCSMEPDTIPLPDIGAFIHHVVADGQTVTDASRARGNRTRSRRSAKRPASAMEQRTGPTSVNESFMWADQYLDSARRSPKGTGSLLKQPCRKASVVSFSCLAACHQERSELYQCLRSTVAHVWCLCSDCS